MSELLTDDDLRTEREPVSDEPAMWRNWWRALRAFKNECDGTIHGADSIVRGALVHPSKEAAERCAAEDDAEELARRGFLTAKYLGALPVGERPA